MPKITQEKHHYRSEGPHDAAQYIPQASSTQRLLSQGIQAAPSPIPNSKRDIAIQCDLIQELIIPNEVLASTPTTTHTASTSTQDTSSVPIPDPETAPIPPLSDPPHIELSTEQKQVLEIVMQGRNVFFTGPAGTGKSLLLRTIIQELRRKYPLEGTVAVTAPTGIAGLNISGSTLHSWAGIGLGKETAVKLATRIAGSRKLKDRWMGTKVLIIDEVSMLDGNLFDKVEYIGRLVRESQTPFGGLQLVISGDFFQLPPVPDQSYKYEMTSTFAFDAKSWPSCLKTTITLNRVFRQRSNEFVDILSSMRIGNLKEAHTRKLRSLERPIVYSDGIEPTALFPLRVQVEKCNNDRVGALPTAPQTFRSIDGSGYDYRGERITSAAAFTLLDRLVSVPKLTLKVGAQVMLIANVIQGVLVNGSVGRVSDFITVREAVTRHITIAEIKRAEGSGRFTDGPMAPILQSEPEPGPINHPESNQQIYASKQRWPLVDFKGTLLLCPPLEWEVQGVIGNVEATRMQVPLIVAYAISIHKSQGQTIERVKVDLDRIFEKGQAYVALSRATSMEGLEITNFQPSKICPHPRVVAWHSEHRLHQRDPKSVTDSPPSL